MRGGDYALNLMGTFQPFYTFKDNPVMYRKIHYWLWRYVIQAYRCKCGSIKNMNMSLKRGFAYDFNRENFEPLCNSCNQKQDWTIEKKINHSVIRKLMWKNGVFDNRDETNMIWNQKKIS